MSAGARPSAPEADSSGHGAGPAPPPAPAPGHGLPSVRLSWTGAALVIAGVVAVTAGELVRAAALTALGAMALVAVAAAAAVVVADWRRLGPRLTIDLAGGPRRVHVGQPVPIWLRATRSGPPLPPGRRRLRRSRPDRAGCRTVLVEDPADAWELWRRRGPVARPPTRRRRRRIPVEVDAPVPTGPAAVVPAVGRGSLRIGPLRAWLADPFGVVEVRLPATSAVTVLVGPPWPAPAPAPVPEPPVRRRPDEPGPPVGRAGRFGEELVGVSGMVAGEPPGRLHWPTSVRCGEPMVLRFAGRTGGDAPVVVHLDARAEVHDFGSFEAAVATAAAEAGAVLSQRRSLLLAGSGDPVLLRPGPNALRDLYDQLAVADLVDARRPQAGRGGRLERVGATTSPTGIRAGSVVVTSPTGASSLRSAPGTRVVVAGGPSDPPPAPLESGWDCADGAGRDAALGPVAVVVAAAATAATVVVLPLFRSPTTVLETVAAATGISGLVAAGVCHLVAAGQQWRAAVPFGAPSQGGPRPAPGHARWTRRVGTGLGGVAGLVAGLAVALVLAGPVGATQDAGGLAAPAAVSAALTDLWSAVAHGAVPASATPGLKLGAATVAVVLAVVGQLVWRTSRSVLAAVAPMAGAVAACGWLGRGHGSGPTVLFFGLLVLAALVAASPLRPAGRSSLLVAAALAAGATLAVVPEAGPGFVSGAASSAQGLGGFVVGRPSADLAAVKLRLSQVRVMTVRSSEPSYWQLTTLARFTGTRWVAGRQDPPPRGAEPAASATESVVQHVQLGQLESPWLPAAAEPVAVRGVPGGQVHPSTGSVTAPTEPAAYTVVSAVPSLPAGQLAALPQPAHAAWLAPDLSLPAVPAVVRHLAHQLVAGITSPYEQALALVAYFDSGRFRYTLSPPPVPAGTNPLVAFLTETRAGYCQQFAGAFGVLARLDGLPTRLAVGFATGSRTGLDTYVVRGADAHVWPEVYLGPEAGWVSFEPTPAARAATPVSRRLGRSAPGLVPSGSAASRDVPPVGVQGLGSGAVGPASSLPRVGPPTSTARGHRPEGARRAPPGPPTTLLALGGAVLAATAAGFLWRRERRRDGGLRRHGGRLSPVRSVDRVVELRWRSAVWALRRAGRPTAAETPTAFVRRLRGVADGELGAGLGDLAALAELVARARYGPPRLEPELATEATVLAQRVRTVARRRRWRGRASPARPALGRSVDGSAG